MIDVPRRMVDPTPGCTSRPSRWPGGARPWFCCLTVPVWRLDHKIADDGTVNPSVQCWADSCGFHEHVRLVGWDESPRRP